MGKDRAPLPEPKAAPVERPPRPSHGHKWDEEKQAWVGKGSVDARKAAKLVDSGPKVLDDGTALRAFQSLPSALLLEWTQKEKRSKPQYSNARSWDATKWHKKVYLEDPKNKDASLEFTPWDDSDTENAAKEHAALLALLKVQGDLPLYKRLPEPYCTLWKASKAESSSETKPKPKSTPKAKSAAAIASAKPDEVESAATGTGPETVGFVPPLRAASSFSSKAERDAAQKKQDEERNKRKMLNEMKERANMSAPIILSRKMRAQLHDALGLREAYESASGDGEVEIGEEDAKALTKCVEQGFAVSDVMRGLSAVNRCGVSSETLAENIRQWLCLHLPEEDLPELFAAGKGQFTVRSGARGAEEPELRGKLTRTSPFEGERDQLLTWLQSQLKVHLPAEDAEAFHASAEAILLGLEVDVASDEDAQEAVDNVVSILGTACCEGLEAVFVELALRWRNIWSAGKAAGLVLEPKVLDDAEDCDADGASTTVCEDASSVCTTAGTELYENGAERNLHSSSAGHRRPQHKGRWFGIDANSPSTLQAEAACEKVAAEQGMKIHRNDLPAAKIKDGLVQLIAAEQVVLIQGETGCGKTTQVGQFLLEADPIARIVVTQPRRLAAVSVAQRVADERGEKLGEGATGYSVRGESRLHRQRCRLLFCTNGVLLRRILGDCNAMFSEQTCTHLIIDEVHERTAEIDLLLTLLHHLLPLRPQLRVVLMSATMDVSKLGAMFNQRPPSLRITGRTFPVQQYFLEDLAEQVGICTLGGSGRGARESDGDADRQGETGAVAASIKYLRTLDFAAVAEVVIALLRGQMAGAPADGAMLIFVPGVGEIDRVTRELHGRISTSEAFVLPLHGGLPPAQQRRCFQVAAKGGPRKIVVSTNVAETSVTVPDVTVVIDTARERRLVLEPGAAASCLSEAVCARSSLTQRKGRAGRVRAGLCVTMLPRAEYDHLPADAPPEIESLQLESIWLQVLVAGFEPESFLAKMPSPPSTARVAAASNLLARIGATRLQQGSNVAVGVEATALGRHLAALPCDVHIGKLLVVGAFLGVASMSLDVAALLSVRSPLKNTMRDPKAEAWRERLRQSLRPGGTKSDHCLYAKILALWRDGGGKSRRELCENGGLVWERMIEAESVRSQLASCLRGLGFDFGKDGDDRSAGEWRALRGAVTAAFYPMIAKVLRPPPKFSESIAGAVEKVADARSLHYFVRLDDEATKAAFTTSNAGGGGGGGKWAQEQRSFLHPASVLFKENSYSCPYVVFSSKQLVQTRGDFATRFATRLNLSDASEASIYALLLFGGKLQVDHSNRVTIDGWINFSGGSATVAGMIERLRAGIDQLLLRKIEEPWLRLGGSKICTAVSTLLGSDGLG